MGIKLMIINPRREEDMVGIKPCEKMKLFWDPSYYCNGKCIYCFTDSLNEKSFLSDKQLKKVSLFIDQMQVEKVSIGGGEPFLSEFTKICKYINKESCISVTTNGTICNDEIINTIIRYNINITVSLDSLNPDYYNVVRKGIELNKVLESIQKLASSQEIRSKLSIRTTVNKYNQNELKGIVDFCVENKITNLKINSTNLYGRAKCNKEIILEFNLFLDKLKQLKEYARKYNNILRLELPIEKYLDDLLQKCTLGKNSLYLDPYGNVFPCAFSEKRLCLGNVYLDTIEDIIRSVETFSHINHICQKCPIHRYEKNR